MKNSTDGGVDRLTGNSSKARQTLGWEPRYSFEELIDEMVRADLDSLRKLQSGVQEI